MADFPITAADYIRPYRSPAGSPVMVYGPTAASQAYRIGEVLEDNGSGAVQLASTSGSTCTSTGIVGVAAEAASTVTGTKVGYFAALPGVEFWARTRGGLTQSTCRNQAYGLFRDSTAAVWLVDLANAVSTSHRAIVTEFVDSTGSSGGAVAFKFGSYNSTLVAFAGQPTA